jgi:RNA recognition motif-containing protein
LQDHEIAQIWVRFLGSLVYCITPQCTTAPTVTSPATAMLIGAQVLDKTENIELQSACLCTLWNLLLCCQPLDSSCKYQLSVAVAVAISSLQKSYSASQDSTSTTVINEGTVACSLIYALACIGSLGGHQSKNAAALSPSQASVALTTAMSVLSNTERNCLIDVKEEWDATQMTWAPLSSAVRATVAVLLASGPAAVNAAYDNEGFTLVHHLAAVGQAKCLDVVLQSAGDSLDLLARTKSGATALQLARQNKHIAAAELLEEVTQMAAEARQAALLEEIEAADAKDSSNKDDSARKAKKKKSVTRSASFAAEQPDEKSQKTEAIATALDHHHGAAIAVDAAATASDFQNEDGGSPSSTSNAASAAEQARVELRQRLEEEYERALEERRLELIKQQQQQELRITHQLADTAMMNSNGDDTSSSAENPSTPRAMLEAGITSGVNNNNDEGGSGSGSNGAGSGSNSGTEDDLMVLSITNVDATTPTMDAAVPAPVSMAATLPAAIPAPVGGGVLSAGEGNALLRRSPSTANMSPFTSPSIPLPNGGRGDLTSMAINTDNKININGGSSSGGGGAGGLGFLDGDANTINTTNASTSIQREHSLFGSPSLTGNLFGAAGSYGSGSPGFSTGLHSGGGSGPFGAGFMGNNSDMNTTTGTQLPDALFIHHGLSTEDLNTTSNNTLSSNASLLASLAGNNNNNNNHVVPQFNNSAVTYNGQRVPSVGAGSATTGTGSGSSDADSDASSDPTRHLWIGNLGTRTPRAVLKAVFEAHGIVEDVVTFPGRMYAFVNYCTTDEAIQATNVLQNQIVPELTGDRPLLLKYRPVKKAEMHLRSLVGGGGDSSMLLDGQLGGHSVHSGLVNSYGSSGGLSALGGSLSIGGSLTSSSAGLRSPGSLGGLMMPGGLTNNPMALSSAAAAMNLNDLDGNCSDPSPRIWLGNIAPTATSKTLQAVLGRFGPLTDAAVFPARIGPLGYAFVKFEALEDAVRALETLNNTVVPPLSGSKQLKMRYKPAASGPAGREESMNESSKSTTMPSRHLWLGNITQKPTEDIIFQAFSKFGRVDSARVFPAKAYAFVNFSDLSAAVRAMTEMEGVCIPCLTGVKPLVMRFQQENQQQPTGPPPVMNPAAAILRSSHSLANMASLAAAGGSFNNSHMSRVQSESALALAASLNQLVPGGGGGGSVHGGYSDDLQQHPHGLVGVVPNTNAPSTANWGPEQAAAMHRSASLTLLSQQAAARGGGAAGTPAPSPFAPNLLGLNDSNSNSVGSATSSQLSAVLNNLAALQRAASIGGVNNGTGAHQDIASLSTMLASQSLASSQEASMQHQMRFNNNGWNSAAISGGVGAATGINNNGLDGLLCPLSKQLMTDPVVAADGVTYHRPAISEWLASQTISPVLQTPLPHGGLVPNHAVKDAVLGYLRMQLGVAA